MNIVSRIERFIPGKQRIIGQFLRYFVTGGLAFVVDFGGFALALYCFNVHYLIANLIGLIGGGFVNYLLSFGWVFSAQKRAMEKHRLLEIIVFVGIFVLQEMLSKMGAAIIVLLYNFFARKYILFKRSSSGN